MNRAAVFTSLVVLVLLASGIVWLSQKSTWEQSQAISPSPVVSVSPTPQLLSDTISGHYERLNGDPASLDVQLVSDSQVRIQGNATWEGDVNVGQVNVGEIDGTIALNGYTTTYENGPCKVTFVFQPNEVHATDNLNCGGLNVSFTGDYAKTDSATNPATDQENQAADLVLKQKEVQDFKARLDQQKVSTLGIRVESTPTPTNPTYSIHVFEEFPDRETTFNWYAVNLETGEVKAQF